MVLIGSVVPPARATETPEASPEGRLVPACANRDVQQDRSCQWVVRYERIKPGETVVVAASSQPVRKRVRQTFSSHRQLILVRPTFR